MKEEKGMKENAAVKKLLVLFLALLLVFSLAACGGKGTEGNGGGDSTPAGNGAVKAEDPSGSDTDPEDGDPKDTSTDPEAENPKEMDMESEGAKSADTEPAPEGAITFEDGLYGFIALDTAKGDADESELSVVDYNSGKALKITNRNGGVPYVAIDASSLTGDKITEIRSMVFDIGTENPDGEFYAASGYVYAYSGESRNETKDAWSVYLKDKNPKTASASLDNEEEYFTAGAKNFFVLTLETDNGKDAGKAPANLFLSNIRFLDGAGNVIPVDTSVGFDAPEGFGAADFSNLLAVEEETPIEGFAVSAGAWAQAGVATTKDSGTFDAAQIRPGSVITIYYSGGGDMWLVGVSDGNPNGDWLRIADGGQSLKNSSLTIAQITYDQIIAVLGEDFASTLNQLQCESDADWAVSKVTVGQETGQ